MKNNHIPPGTIPGDAEPHFEPIFGKVIIKVTKDAERKYGSLYLPQRSMARSTIGTVHAVYKAATLSDGAVAEPEVSVGDTVIFGQFTGTTLEIGSELFVVCKEHDLLTKVSFPSGTPPEIEELS
jgi:chaperonin GroES